MQPITADNMRKTAQRVLVYPKLGTPEDWAAQGRLEYRGPVPCV